MAGPLVSNLASALGYVPKSQEEKILALNKQLTTQNASLKQQLTTLTSQNNGYKSQISTLQSQVTALTNKQKTLNANIATLNGQVSTLTNNVNSRNNTIAGLQKQVSTLDATNATDASKIKTLNSQISSLQTANAADASQISSLGSQITSLKSQLNTVNAQLLSANGQISTLKQTIASNDSRISSLSSEITALDKQISTLNSTLSTDKAEISSLTSKNASLTQQLSTYTQDAQYWKGLLSHYNITVPPPPSFSPYNPFGAAPSTKSVGPTLADVESYFSGISQKAGYWQTVASFAGVSTPTQLENIIKQLQSSNANWENIVTTAGCKGSSDVQSCVTSYISKIKTQGENYVSLEKALPFELKLSEQNSALNIAPFTSQTNHYYAEFLSNGSPVVGHPVTLYRPDTGNTHGTVATDGKGIATFSIGYAYAGAYVYQARTTIARLKGMTIYSNPVAVAIHAI